MKRMKELRGTVNLREQFWVDLKNSQWAKDADKRRDDLIVKIMTGEKMVKDHIESMDDVMFKAFDEGIHEKTAKKIGKLVDKKNKAYGDSFNRADRILKELYPNGVQPKDYRNLLALIRIIDKLFRIANDQDAFGEDPWQDIVGYGLLACGKKNEKER